MKISTSLIPELVFYKCFSECTIQEALLQAFIDAPNNSLSLPNIGKIKVNGNRLLGSYGNAIMKLRRKGYDIKMNIYHNNTKHITEVSYTLLNKTYSGCVTD